MSGSRAPSALSSSSVSINSWSGSSSVATTTKDDAPIVEHDECAGEGDTPVKIISYGSTKSNRANRSFAPSPAGGVNPSMLDGSEVSEFDTVEETHITGAPHAPGTTLKHQRTLSFSQSDADSEVLMARAEEITDKYNIPQLKHWYTNPSLRNNARLIVASVVLTAIGIACIASGITLHVMPTPNVQGWVFIVIGLICFIPGFYHVFYVVCALRGKSGYSFHRLPAFT